MKKMQLKEEKAKTLQMDNGSHQMDRKKIGFGENGGEFSSLMANKPEQCSKQLNHSFSDFFFSLLICLGAVSLLHPYSTHYFFLSLSFAVSLFSP